MALCKECGSLMSRTGRTNQQRIFCQPACKLAWNNRRKLRGALIYDLFMENRYRRHNTDNVWSDLCELARQFHEEDKAQRGGRQSWQSHDAVLEARPSLRTKVSHMKIGRAQS